MLNDKIYIEKKQILIYHAVNKYFSPNNSNGKNTTYFDPDNLF